jgi:hypothetical protein
MACRAELSSVIASLLKITNDNGIIYNETIDNSTFRNQSDIGQAVQGWTENYNAAHRRGRETGTSNALDYITLKQGLIKSALTIAAL